MVMDTRRFGGSEAEKPTRPPSNIGYDPRGRMPAQARPPLNIGYNPRGKMPAQARPPSNIGYDRMGGMQSRPPSNIGYDRMGGGGPPSNIGYDRMGGGPAIGNTAGRRRWGNEADIHRYKTGHLPGFGIVGQGRNIPHKSLSEATRGYESLESTPRGSYLPDRFGRMRPIDTGIGGLQEQAAIDPSDWRILQQIIKAGGNPDDYLSASSDYDTGLGSFQVAEGPGIRPQDDDDYYGPFIAPSVFELDRDFLYGPEDEYEFDRKKGYKNRIYGKNPVYSARGGIIG